MARLRFKAGDAYAAQLSKLAGKSTDIAKKAVYEGAKVVADTTKAELEALPTDTKDEQRHKYAKGQLFQTNDEEKRVLIEAFGLAPIEIGLNSINTKTGVDGYAADHGGTPTSKYPKGLPLPMLARAANSGSTVRAKTGVFDRAKRKSKRPAEQKMGEVVTREISKVMK